MGADVERRRSRLRSHFSGAHAGPADSDDADEGDNRSCIATAVLHLPVSSECHYAECDSLDVNDGVRDDEDEDEDEDEDGQEEHDDVDGASFRDGGFGTSSALLLLHHSRTNEHLRMQLTPLSHRCKISFLKAATDIYSAGTALSLGPGSGAVKVRVEVLGFGGFH